MYICIYIYIYIFVDVFIFSFSPCFGFFLKTAPRRGLLKTRRAQCVNEPTGAESDVGLYPMDKKVAWTPKEVPGRFPRARMLQKGFQEGGGAAGF